MAFYDTTWYLNFGNGTSTGYYAVTVRPQNTAVAAGVIRRQFTAPATNNERCFVCIVAGTTANVTDATWVLTRGAKTTDGTATWQECTGAAAVNGDATNTVNWTAAKAAGTPTLGAIIKRNSGASYQICSTAGTMAASEPAFSDTAGVTTTDGTSVWTSLGPVGNFTGGQAPFARLLSAVASTWFVVGNTLYVGGNHAETQSTALNLTFTGGTTLSKIICHNQSGSYPPNLPTDLRTTAMITTAGANVAQSYVLGFLYIYGLNWTAGSGAFAQTSYITFSPSGSGYSWVYFDNCSFQMVINATNCQMAFANNSTTSNNITLNNCTFGFGHIQQSITVANSNFTWRNTGQVIIGGTTAPTCLIGAPAVGAFIANIVMEALDLSQIPNTISWTFLAGHTGSILIKDCKLSSTTAALINTPFTYTQVAPYPGVNVQYVRCDSAGTHYKTTRFQFEGSDLTETDVVRVGGAVDPSGRASSRKLWTNGNAQWLKPLRATPCAVWNSLTATNVAVTVYGITNALALPNNDDIWMEVEYLGSNATPLGTIVTTTKATFWSANAAVTSDSSSWNTAASAVFDDLTTVNVRLSNSCLTALLTGPSVNSGTRSLSGQTTGKYYFEITATTTHGFNDTVGIIEATVTYQNAMQSLLGCFAIAFGSGSIYFNNTSSAGMAIVAGDVVCFAVDLTARKGWVRKNNGLWNNVGGDNPATGTGGKTIGAGTFAPFIGFSGAGSATNDVMTGNLGGTSYVYAAPSGFGNWPSTWTKFKLTTTLYSPQPGLPGYIDVRVRVGKASAVYYIDPQITLAAVGPLYTGFDSATANGVTISNANLRATLSSVVSSQNIAKSISYQTTGKYYFEVTAGTLNGNQNQVGVILSTSTYIDVLFNLFNCSTVANNYAGSVFSNNGNSGYSIGSWGTGDTICCAIDMTNRKSWFRKNGGLWNGDASANPATNVNGVTIAATGSFAPHVGFNNGQAVNDYMTANFGSASFLYSAPSGFVGWPA